MGLFDWFSKSEQDRFAQAVIKSTRAAAPGVQIEYDKDEFVLNMTFPDGGTGQANLQNSFIAYNELDKRDRTQHISQVVRAFLSPQKELPEDFDDAKHDLLPTLRSRSYFELTMLRTQLGDGDPLSWPYQEVGEHLGLGLVYDLPEATRGITQDDLDDWQISFYEAMEIARHNLDQREVPVAQAGDGFYMLASGDSFDATRMTMLELVRALDVNGDHIAMVPNRDTLLITGSHDKQGLAMMLELGAKTYQESHHPMLATAFRLAGDEWTPWLPDPDHELCGRFKELAMQSIGCDYEDQKELLDQLHEKRGVDEFVASFGGVEHNNELVSYAMWLKGVVSLLPETDVVMFFDPDIEDDEGKIVATADWALVRQVMGDSMQLLDDLYPARYRVSEFPSEQQIEALDTGQP